MSYLLTIPMYFFDEIDNDKNDEKVFINEKDFNEYFELMDDDFSISKVIETEDDSFNSL